MTKRETATLAGAHNVNSATRDRWQLHEASRLTSKPSRLRTAQNDIFQKQLPITPDSGGSSESKSSANSPNISPKDERMSNVRDHRKDLAALDTSGGQITSPSQAPAPSSGMTSNAQIAPWEDPAAIISNGFSPGYHTGPQAVSQPFPSLQTATLRTEASDSSDTAFHPDDRRPSVASATTISSFGSGIRSSAKRDKSHRKLTGLFGESASGQDSQRTSESSTPAGHRDHSAHSNGGRSNSVQTNYTDGGPYSPSSSRPRTPLPSSDVTPWVFQEFTDIAKLSDARDANIVAAIRKAPAGPDKHRYAEGSLPADHHHHHFPHFHFPSHKHSRSCEEPSRAPNKEASQTHKPRPKIARDDSSGDFRRPGENKSYPMNFGTPSGPRPPSPGSSIHSGNGQYSPTGKSSPAEPHAGKRSIFDKLRRHKGDKGHLDSLKNLTGSSRSLQDPNASSVTLSRRRSRDGSVATFDSGATLKANEHTIPDEMSQKKGAGPKILHSHGKFPKPSRRGLNSETSALKESNKNGNLNTTNGTLFELDTDLTRMEGIIAQPNPDTPPSAGIFTGEPEDEGTGGELKDLDGYTGPGAWDAPDSWAVKKVGDENLGRLREIDEAGVPAKDEDDGMSHCVRIFRVDSTFATLSTNVNTSVSEILQMLGRKSFLQDDLGNYQIIMRQHDLQRQLAPGERPVAIQKRLLEQAGYTINDRIEEVGREDNSYLCRFTFVPTKLSGYYSLEQDPGLGKMQKFSHVDLSGRSLVTIPLALYKNSSEIVSLNLSRNLSLDVPKDFIQGCNNLREIKFIGNDAWKLPASLSLASKLTYLDISNNRLEQLEHADLDKIHGLVSIKMSNNKLTGLPMHFGQYKSLRSLNLSSNYLTTFPEFLCDLKSLVDLDISFNAITALPDIGKLSTLERLWATNNMLSGSLPDTFRDLRSLKEIDIRFNGLASIDVMSYLPKLEQLMVGHNAISKFEGAFAKIRILHLDHNPLTSFDLTAPVPTLTSLNIASAKLASLNNSLFDMTPNLAKFIMDKNQFAVLSPQIGKLRKLEYLSTAKNPLSSLPATIGCLQELRYLDVRECNLKKLPAELWCCLRLDTFNVSSNVLESFPKPDPTLTVPQPDWQSNGTYGSVGGTTVGSNRSYEELGKLEDFGHGHRRPSQASAGLLSVGSSPANSTRKGSIVSVYGPGGRKASVISRTPTAPTETTLNPVNRKDSNFSNRITTTFAGSLRNLYIADNRLNDEVFDEITLLPELRVLNLSYNDLADIPQRSLRRWPHLSELYLSGNNLSSLPSDDLEEFNSLKVLHLNGNKFQQLPAELGKVQKLAILDVGSNSLKYNVSNWPYDWNWKFNKNLKYLNFSGNKRLEIKPSPSFPAGGGRDEADQIHFNMLQHLRVLGLMDVTLTIPSVPEPTDDRRVRTSGSLAGSLAYGMADSLGKNEHLSTIDMVVPNFRSHQSEIVLGMFDGQALSHGGSKVARFLHENFKFHFTDELSKLKAGSETPVDALRRTFLVLNKELATAASQSLDEREHRVPHITHRGSVAAQTLSHDDLKSGGVATVLYLDNMDLYIANVGDAQAMLMQSDGGFKTLTRKHDPAEPRERQRIREAGGYVSRHGKLNDILDVSRAFGYIHMMPAVMAAPHVIQITLKEQDEMVLIASRELWEYLTPDVVVDVARSERGDPMRAAQKLRDLAIAFGATGKIMVMIIGISDLKKRERNRFRSQSRYMGPSQVLEDPIFPSKRGKRPRDGPDDSTLGRLDQEVEAPTGHVALIFTDIKNSTLLWEMYPAAMRAAIKEHNSLMRRQLRVIGGYEVKTEGDAFMVCFPTATSALLWTFAMQSKLLTADWPTEITSSVHGQEVFDADQNLIFCGLSVRMGIHWGNPVCETDPVTRRMDYFGPVVNRASRISSVADGGQITVSSDFVSEIERCLETYQDTDRSSSTGSEDTLNDDIMGQAIRRELRVLSTQGFEVKDLGEKKLKGLENPEYVYLMYPHVLAGRLIAQQQRADAEAAAASNDPGTLTRDSQLTMNLETKNVWDLWTVSLRLEMLCSALECPGATEIKTPETALMERMKNRGGEVTDRFLVHFVEHQVSRIESCITTLAVRNMIRPFVSGRRLLDQACPMGDILDSISSQLAELRAFKEYEAPSITEA